MNTQVLEIPIIDTMYDSLSGRYFKCTEKELTEYINEINLLRELSKEQEIDLNTWYDIIGLPRIEIGNCFRWQSWKDIGKLNIQCYPDIHDNGIVHVIKYESALRFIRENYKY